jgi:hypothetical protein
MRELLTPVSPSQIVAISCRKESRNSSNPITDKDGNYETSPPSASFLGILIKTLTIPVMQHKREFRIAPFSKLRHADENDF